MYSKWNRNTVNTFKQANACHAKRLYSNVVLLSAQLKSNFHISIKLESWLTLLRPFARLAARICDSTFRRIDIQNGNSNKWQCVCNVNYNFITIGYQSHLWLGVVFDNDQSVLGRAVLASIARWLAKPTSDVWLSVKLPFKWVGIFSVVSLIVSDLSLDNTHHRLE